MEDSVLELPILLENTIHHRIIFLQRIDNGQGFILTIIPTKDTLGVPESFEISKESEAQEVLDYLEQKYDGIDFDTDEDGSFIEKIKEFMRDPPD